MRKKKYLYPEFAFIVGVLKRILKKYCVFVTFGIECAMEVSMKTQTRKTFNLN